MGDFKRADVHGYSAYLDKLPAGIAEYLNTPAVTPLKTLSPTGVKQAVQRIFSRWAAQANGLLRGLDGIRVQMTSLIF